MKKIEKIKKISALIFLFAIISEPVSSWGQSIADYGFITGIAGMPTGTSADPGANPGWVDLNDTTHQFFDTAEILTFTGNDALASNLQGIGFYFPFGGTTISTYSVNSDGNMRLGSTVTGTNWFSLPFSTFNADFNNPKINILGCDGYGVEGIHYVKSALDVLPGGMMRLIVEFCLGTNATATRNNQYKWQIHLISNGNINIVFPPEDEMPPTGPAVSHQSGFGVSSNDLFIIKSSTNTAQHYTTGTTASDIAYSWFDANRYFSFIHPNNITCPAPTNVNVSNIGTNSATLTWSAGGDESLWEVVIGNVRQECLTSSYTVGGLDANTDYTVEVRGICGAGDTSLAASCSFRTACNDIDTFPYIIDFEDSPYYPTSVFANAMPDCWRRINDGSEAYNYYPYVTMNEDLAYSGTKGLLWYHGVTSSVAQNEYVILPAIELMPTGTSADPGTRTWADMTLAFYARTTDVVLHPTPIVGVMSDPTDASTFTPVYIFSNDEIGYDWQHYVVPLSSYNGNGRHVAIKWTNPGIASYLAMDDIYLTDHWCNTPLNVTATPGVNEITLCWERNGGTSFSVIIDADEDVGGPGDTLHGITDTFYTFNNLARNSEYHLEVATECASGTSIYVRQECRTLCGYLDSLPYSESFEGELPAVTASENNIPYCWNYLNTGSDAEYSIYPLVLTNNTYAHSGNRSLKFTTYSTPGPFSDQYAIMPITDSQLYPVNHLKVSFWLSASSALYNHFCVVGVMSNPTDSSTFVPVDTIYTNRSTAYTHHTVLLNGYTGPHGHIAFKFPQPMVLQSNPNLAAINSGYVDDIIIEEMAPCPHVVSHNVTATASAAIITWESEHGYAEMADCYQVNALTSQLINLSTYQLINLEPDSSYSVTIKPCCSINDSNEYTFTFHTLAANGDCIPPAVNVEQNDDGNVVVSWIPGNNETSWNLDYRAADSDSWNSIFTSTTARNYTFPLDELRWNTEYLFRVTANCTDTTISSIVSFTTHCIPIAIPYIQNFEEISGTNSVPPCWYHHNNGDMYQSSPRVIGSTAHSGTHCLAWQTYQPSQALRTYYQMIVLPELNVAENAINTLLLSFWARTYYITNKATLLVGVMSDPNEPESFELVDSVKVDTTTQWGLYEIYLENYNGNGNYVAIRANRPQHGGWTVYMDDIQLDVAPECRRVTGVSVTNITTGGATVSWNATTATGYEVMLVAQGDVPEIHAFTNSNTTVINNLLPNTVYDVYVRGICYSDTSQWSFPITFRTECTAINSLPFFEDFDNYPSYSNYNGSNPFIPCWTRLNNGVPQYSGIPHVSSNGNHTPHGSKCISWMNCMIDVYGDYMYMILPEIDTSALPINTLQLSLWAKSQYVNYRVFLEVGVMEDNNDTTFWRIDTIGIFGNTDWKKYIIDFDQYIGPARFIAIRALRSETSTVLIDDITLDRIPLCPRVENLNAIIPMHSSAVISWSDSSGNTGWNVEYDTVEFEPGTGYMTAMHVTDTFCTITGLDSGSIYHVYVYPDCNGEVFATHTRFSTIVSSPATVPYYCSFEETGSSGWTFENGNEHNHWIIGNSSSTWGDKSLYITDDGTTNEWSSVESSVFAFRQIELLSGDYICSYDYRTGGYENENYLRVALIPDYAPIYAGSYCGMDPQALTLPADYISLDGNSFLNSQPYWLTSEQHFTVSSPGVYKLVFFWHNGIYHFSRPAPAIDNIRIINDNCQPVSNISANVYIDTADLYWTPGGSEIGWIINLYYDDSSFVRSEEPTVTYQSTNVYYQLTGLEPNTHYIIEIRGICSVGDTSLPRYTTIHTHCTPVSLPYIEDFDGETNSLPCWQWVVNGQTPYVRYYEGERYYCIDGIGYYSLPPMPVPLNQLQLSFLDYRTWNRYGLEVGVMEGNNFVPIADINSTQEVFVQHEVDFSNYNGSSRIIAFHNYHIYNNGSSPHYIDNIRVDYIASCPSVVDVKSRGTTTSSITLDWTDRCTASQWEIAYGVGSATGSADVPVGTHLFVNSHPVVISDLSSLTEYDFYVRPICSEGDTGIWSQKATLASGICDNGSEAFTGAPRSTTWYAPINHNFKYSICEIIIDSAELADLNYDTNALQDAERYHDIEQIAFRYDDENPLQGINNVTIWLQPTEKKTFTNTHDFILLDTFTAVKVYQGNLNCTEGWNYFSFNNAYAWNGHSGLVAIIDDNSNCGNRFTTRFNTSTCNGTKTLYYSNNSNPNPLDATDYVGSMGALTSQRPTMKLVSCGQGCHTPYPLPTTDITHESATLNWNSSADTIEIAIKTIDEPSWPESTHVPVGSNSESADVPVSILNPNFSILNLEPNTTYQFRIRTSCSDWAEGSFTTIGLPCVATTELHTTDIDYTTATLAWTPTEAQNQWIVRVWNPRGGDIQTISSATPTLTITRLQPGTTYCATVKGDCGADYEDGAFSDTIQFTTAICDRVSGVTVDEITATTALVSWNASDATKYEINYGDRYINEGTGTSIIVENATSYLLTGLTPNHYHSVFVRAYCQEDVIGAWSVRVDFATPDYNNINTPLHSTPYTLNIYPNPTTGTFTISLGGAAFLQHNDDIEISIIDINGRIIESYHSSIVGRADGTPQALKHSSIQTLKHSSIHNLPPGTYFIRAKGDNIDQVKRLIVK